MTTTIKCKNCKNTKKYPGTTMPNLQFFESNERDDKNWCCDSCENKYLSEIIELRKYKLEKLKSEIVKGVFDGVFSPLTPPLSRSDVDDLLKIHRQCLQGGNSSAREKLEAKIKFCKGRLPSSKSDEVISQLLGEQLEICELEKQLNLQIQKKQIEILAKK